ncbi:MAG: hypothetical protein LBT56_06145, partial [Prevotellaceae bacterium]|nr:hypothetical protein [Prevotellaceae bacterium]
MKLRLLLALLIFPLIAYAQEDNDNPNTIHLGFQADFMRPAYPSYLNGRQVHKHEGNVIYTHKTNGATITCDSAYHYYPSDTIEFFGNVVVTHQTTVLLSEKIFYDGIFAKVRGRLVKMYDSERNATLKTQFVDYNIDQNIGTYSQGGTLARARDTIESINGIFDGNTGVFTFINDVAMKNDSIILVCDTMLYDTHNDITTFIGNTKAWNGNNLILSDYGWYKPNENQISFSNNTYVQSATQEIWADSVCFDDKTKNAELFRDVQMIDTTQNIIIFGDKALINDNYETVIITENPAALYYTVAKTPEQLSDTTYLIADTICSLFQKVQIKKDCDTCKIIQIKDTATTQISVKDTVNKNIFEQDTISKNTNLNDTTLQNVIIQDTTIQNILQDTISKNTILNDTILQNIIIQDTATKNILQDTISKNILQDTTTQSIALPDTVSKNITIQDTATKNILQNTTSKNITRNVKLQNPSQMDSIPQSTQDTVSKNVIISDTTVRNVFAYHNVKIFKSDFQALCDSLIYHSVDSTTYMYHTPILWNDSTQITSGPSVFYSKN